MLGFLNITIIDVIDIILVAFLIYQCFRLLKGTSVIGIAIGIVTLYVFWFVVSALNMDLLSSIMEQVLGVGVIALIILFQQEIRKFLFQIGKRSINSRLGKLSRRFLNSNNEVDAGSIEEITQACRRMSETRTGALMVFRRISSMENIIETGDKVDSIINRRLIENIFWKNTPLHDGAMIVDNNRIVAARCFLTTKFLIFKIIVVTSSITPSIFWNSCITPSIFTDITLLPGKLDSITLRRAFPIVVPKPLSSGSSSNLP